MERLKVVGLMTLMTLLLVGIGGYVGGNSGATMFFVISLAMNFGMYWFSDKIVLKQYKAHVVQPGEEGGRFDALYTMIDRLRQNAGLPMPTVAVSEQMQPNAFATGRNHKHAVVCVTRGMWELVARGQMTQDELEGVMAHELAHIKHRHMLVGTIAASMAGAIMLIGRILQFGAIFGGGRGGERGGGNPLALIALAILAPLAAMVVQMAISRRNEFVADAGGAAISGKPLALASALRKIETIARGHPMEVTPSAAHMAIINPLAGMEGVSNLFRTHPQTDDRVARLQQIAGEQDVVRLTRPR
ncbi:MAG: M48 family metalloprotease [Gemmatimonadota bacterium]|jgi:heat shock protein HtpX|nr:M48 family metalloprotease [Gemmatimonadota bacterium]